MIFLIEKPEIVLTEYHEKLYAWMSAEYSYDNVNELYAAMEKLCQPLFHGVPLTRCMMCKIVFNSTEIRDKDLVSVRENVKILNDDLSIFETCDIQNFYYLYRDLMRRDYQKDIDNLLDTYNEKLLSILKTRCLHERGFVLRDTVCDNMDLILQHYPEILGNIITDCVKKGLVMDLFSKRKTTWMSEEVTRVIERWMDHNLVIPWNKILCEYDIIPGRSNIDFGKYNISIDDINAVTLIYNGQAFPFSALIHEIPHISELSLL